LPASAICSTGRTGDADAVDFFIPFLALQYA
jgi:hypothetical protein